MKRICKTSPVRLIRPRLYCLLFAMICAHLCPIAEGQIVNFSADLAACIQFGRQAPQVTYIDAPSDRDYSSKGLAKVSTTVNGTTWMMPIPEYVTRFLQHYPAKVSRNNALLFAGELRNGAGEDRIVVVCRYIWGSGQDTYATPLRVYVLDPSKNGSAGLKKHQYDQLPNGVALPIPRGHTLTIYTGQCDSADPRRFTIRYDEEGKSGSIVGQLHNDESVDIHIASGPGAVHPATTQP